MGKAVIHAKAKVGELLKAIPKKYVGSGKGTIEKKKSLPAGISKRTSHQAQTIANNLEMAEAEILDAINYLAMFLLKVRAMQRKAGTGRAAGQKKDTLENSKAGL